MLFFRSDLEGIESDGQLFVGGDDPNLNLAVLGGDLGLVVRGGVLLGVDVDAEEAQALADPLTGADVVLADAGSEDDGVAAVHGGDVGADVLLDGVGPHLDGQLGVFVASIVAGGDVRES